MVFEDRHEVVFERVKIGDKKMDIVVENINGSMNPVFRIEESEFPGMCLNETNKGFSKCFHSLI